VLAPRVVELLVLEHHQRAADAPARLVRLDDVVDEAALGRDEGVGEAGLVFSLLGGSLWLPLKKHKLIKKHKISNLCFLYFPIWISLKLYRLSYLGVYSTITFRFFFSKRQFYYYQD
jgi:hypothetical protein